MAFACKDLDESNIAAAETAVSERFCPEAFAMLRKLLSNPLRSPGDDIGSVVCAGDDVAGVTGSIVRRLYFGREPFSGINGGFLAMRHDAPPTLLFLLLKRAHRPRFGSVLFYSNSCSPATAKMKPCVGVKNVGPDSWTEIRYARLRRYPSFRRRVKRSLGLSLPEFPPFAKRPVSPLLCAKEERVFAADAGRGLAAKARSDFAWADDFFSAYLKDNDGVVSSRTTAELDWFFGDEVANGLSIVLTAEGPRGVEGYVVLRPCLYDPSRWFVADAIALGNDRAVLALLFKAAKASVLECSGAERLEILGFPMAVRPVIAKAFPKSRPTPCNGFMWGFSDADFERRCGGGIADEKGWFFGPYDGDFCLCLQ